MTVVLFGLAAAVTIGLYVNYTRRAQPVDAGTHRTALLVPAIHPAMDEIEQGIRATMAAEGKGTYLLDVYNGNGNKTLIRSQAEEIISGNYEVVYVIGSGCAQLLAELTKKKESSLPVVFTAVDSDPVKMGIVPSLESSLSNVTGCIVEDNFAGQFDQLRLLKPTSQRVLFVYDPSHNPSMHQKKQQIEQVVQARGMQLTAVEVFSTGEIVQKVSPNIKGVDVILVYTDHTVVSGMDALITLANKYQVTLLASDLNSADKGAAIAYGVREFDNGACAARKGLAIMDDNKTPRAIPITPVTNYRVKINPKTMNAQGLPLTQQQLEMVIKEGGLLVGGAQ